MHNKVTWKKGMRLSPEIFNAMDRANDEAIRWAALVGSGGRYGLFTTERPFELSVNINGNALEVTSLSCHGITKSGCIIDIEYDSNYVNTFDTRVALPNGIEGDAYYLVVKIQEGKWREISEIYSELVYSFDLLGENSIIPDNCLPIGMIVNQYGWRMNESDFVPPCLYVSSHSKFINQIERAKTYSKEIFLTSLTSHSSVAKSLLAMVWSASSNAYSRFDKERDTITPGQLYSSIQELITSFMIGCFVDEYVTLDNPDPFVLYSQKAYDAKNIYKDIETGLSLCAEISNKISAVCSMTESTIPVEEKVTSKPITQPIPDSKSGRHRWEGIEI